MRYWVFLLCCACGTMNTARPLDKGQTAIGLSLGGPMVEFGGAFVPLPNAILEGKTGMKPINGHNWDVNYGINLTALAFDQAGLHAGASYQLQNQNGNIPAISLGNRLFLYNNYPSPASTEEGKGIWANDEINATFSWKIGKQMVYTGISQYFDLSAPSLTLTPFVGCELFHSGLTNGFALQFELRNYAVGRNPTVNTAKWNAPFGSGAFGGSLGFIYRFGGAQ